MSGAVSAVIGTALWLALVVALPDGRTTSPAFWWLMLVAAIGLGAAFGTPCLLAVTLGLGLPPLVLAFWTAPRGDEDGLWLLWLPTLAGFVAVIAVAAWLGAKARERVLPGS